MELYQLRTFLAVAAEGHLTRAAERVHTSAPAVSAQLKALEDELGVRLFDRGPRGMALTAAGERLRAEAQRTVDAAQGLRHAAAQLRGEAHGPVRMGTVFDPLRLRLGELFVRLAERNPDIVLRLQQGLSQPVIADVRRGLLDCACVMHAEPALDGLALRRLMPVAVVPVLPAAWGGGVPATLEALAARRWVMTPPACGLRAPLEQLFREAGREPAEAAMADNEAGIRGMVAAGLGAGLMREDQAREAERLGELRVWDGWRSRTWLCWVAPLAPPEPALAAVRALVDELWPERESESEER